MELTSMEDEWISQKIRQALRLRVPYTERATGSSHGSAGVPAAVLVLIGIKDGTPCLLITRRTESVETHQGQMAFPGGVCAPHEVDGENSVLTALRETEEEVGIAREWIRVLGELPPLRTVTDFQVTPIVGVLTREVGAVSVTPNPDEVAEAIWVPLHQLSDPAVYKCERIRYGVAYYLIHVYQIGKNRIWGATGAMIRNLIDRLKQVEMK